MATRKKKKNTGQTIKNIVVVAIMACILVLAYYRVANTQKKTTTETEVSSAVDDVLLRNMDKNYPPSPKEVIKYYSELTKCLYNIDCTDEQIEQLALRAMELYDDDLVANQRWERYIMDLKSEIATKKSQKYAIMSYNLSASTDVQFFTKDSYECASLYCTYNIRNGSAPGKVEELFILRKDEAGHWRILGWDLPQENSSAQVEVTGFGE